jgi:hypothetical protein
MPLTAFQKKILKLLAANRSPDDGAPLIMFPIANGKLNMRLAKLIDNLEFT